MDQPLKSCTLGDTYIVDMTPQSVESFYQSAHAECGSFHRGFIDPDNFHLSCYGDANPTGWYYLEIGRDSSTSMPRAHIVVEVG